MTLRELDLMNALRSTAALPVTDDDLEQAGLRLREGVKRHQQRRRQATIALAAVLVTVLTVAAALLVWSGRGETNSLPAQTPSTTVGGLPTIAPYVYSGEPSPIPTVGLIGLPPPGASSSSTEQASEVIGFQLLGGGMPYRGSARLFADGRLVWYMFHGPGNSRSTGYIEQRLSPSGVQILMSQPVGAERDPWNLEKWLPESAWADKTLRPYVPTRYGACVHVQDPDAPIEERVWGTPGVPTPSEELLALLPPTAAELLQGREALPPLDDAEDCLSLTTAEARVLDRSLVAAGFEKDDTYVLQYGRPMAGSPEVLWVRLEPVMPDGTVGCSACG